MVPFLVTALALTAFLALDRQPRYAGRSLLDWLTEYRSGPDVRDRFLTIPVEWEGRVPTAQQKEAAEAVHHIGTNALPCLVKWLQYTEPWSKRTARAILVRLPSCKLTETITRKFPDNSEIEMRGCGMLGLALLGSEGKSRKPEFLRLAEADDRQLAFRGMACLAVIGTEGLNSLITIAGDTNHPNQMLAVNMLARFRYWRKDASPAVPLLARLAQDEDEEMAREAIYTLCNLGLEPSICFPVFTNVLASTNTGLKVHTIHHLGYFGPAAVLRPLVPCLTNCLADPDNSVRMQTIQMLTYIDPQTVLHSSDRQIRSAALDWLALVGTSTPGEVLPEVRACLTDPDEQVRGAASNALAQVTKDLQRHAATPATNTAPQ